jgi:hypothetical protein
MPTLSRFVRTILLLALVGYAILLALAMLVDPRTRPVREPIDSRILREAGRPEPPGEAPASER